MRLEISMRNLRMICIIAWQVRLPVWKKMYPNPLSEQELFDLFDHFRYIVPQGSPMTGIGNDYQIASLSNCFVIGLDGKRICMVRLFVLTKNRYN